jgi:membrane-associated phospholipid phosphatase
MLQELLSRRLRLPAAALLVTCAAVTAVLAVPFAGRGQPGWFDSALDPRIQAELSRFPVMLSWLPDLGTLGPVALITLALVVACAAARRWSGAILAAIAVPAAIGLTEYVLKPSVGRVIEQAFPSGHATGMFALATVCAVLLVGPRRHVPGAVRLLLVLAAQMLAAAVSAAMVAIGAHHFTDAVAGAAVGTGLVLTCALTVDLVISRPRRERAPRSIPTGDQRQTARSPDH